MAAQNTPTALDREQIFGMAEKEMEYRVDLFNRLTHSCFNKCVEKRHKESELNMGENSCIDRCVSKILAGDKSSGPDAWKSTSDVKAWLLLFNCLIPEWLPIYNFWPQVSIEKFSVRYYKGT